MHAGISGNIEPEIIAGVINEMVRPLYAKWKSDLPVIFRIFLIQTLHSGTGLF